MMSVLLLIFFFSTVLHASMIPGDKFSGAYPEEADFLNLQSMLEMYIRSCAGGTSGFGSDKDPSRIGDNFLNRLGRNFQIVFRFLEKSSSSDDRISKNEFDVLRTIFGSTIIRLRERVRSAITDRRLYRREGGWLSERIPAGKLAPAILGNQFIVKILNSPNMDSSEVMVLLNDAKSLLMHVPVYSDIITIRNRNNWPRYPSILLANAYRVCKTSPSSPIDDSWYCIDRVWKFTEAVSYTSVCRSEICIADRQPVYFKIADLMELIVENYEYKNFVGPKLIDHRKLASEQDQPELIRICDDMMTVFIDTIDTFEADEEIRGTRLRSQLVPLVTEFDQLRDAWPPEDTDTKPTTT